MQNFTHLDIDKSVLSGKLIYRKDWIEYLDTITFSAICLPFIIIPILLLTQANINNSNDKIIAVISIIIVLPISTYALYRKLTENSLFKIETNFDRTRNKELVKAFLESNGYSIFTQSAEIIIARKESELSYNWLWTKNITILISDGALFMNMVKNYPKVNPPVMFSHLLLSSDLKKFIISR